MTTVKSSRKAPRRTRAQWHKRFTADRERGLSGVQIARRQGVGHTFVYSVLNDPTGQADRKRKQRYGGTCDTCGNRTHGSDGAAKAPTRCAKCTAISQHDERYWTPEQVIASIREFVAQNGRPPTAQEWLHGSNGYAPVTVVQREFGSWLNGLRAAGCDVPDVGKYERTEKTRRLLGVVKSTAGIHWTDTLVLRAIRRWKREHGQPPSTSDWRPATKDHPSVGLVARRFGSWSAGLRAAGLEPRRGGRRRTAA